MYLPLGFGFRQSLVNTRNIAVVTGGTKNKKVSHGLVHMPKIIKGKDMKNINIIKELINFNIFYPFLFYYTTKSDKWQHKI